MSRQVKVFIACSVDGFIAGPNDELDWLDEHQGAEDTFTPFFAGVGALLMGRRTFDVVTDFEGPWPYGETPVLVATRRPLETSHNSVRPIEGSVKELVEEAKFTSGDKDVYLDGGGLIRSALESDLVDEIILTLIPVILGRGIPLFAGLEKRARLALRSTRSIGGGLVELVYGRAIPN